MYRLGVCVEVQQNTLDTTASTEKVEITDNTAIVVFFKLGQISLGFSDLLRFRFLLNIFVATDTKLLVTLLAGE